MEVKINEVFDPVSDDSRDWVLEISPSVFSDARGSFAEVFKEDAILEKETSLKWLSNLSWVKQVNRSKSIGKTVRGCHAQRGQYCQGKLVTALTEKIYDIITDARPDSKTFGVSSLFLLDPSAQNMVWVPRGFLHAFAVPDVKSQAVFEYWCDNTYDKPSELGVNPMSILPKIADELKEMSEHDSKLAEKFFDFIMLMSKPENLVLSEKDTKAEDYESFMKRVKSELDESGTLWYK